MKPQVWLSEDQTVSNWTAGCLQVLAAAVVARRALQSEGGSHQALEHAQSLTKAVRTLCRVRTAFTLLNLLDADKPPRCADDAQCPAGMRGVYSEVTGLMMRRPPLRPRIGLLCLASPTLRSLVASWHLLSLPSLPLR